MNKIEKGLSLQRSIVSRQIPKSSLGKMKISREYFILYVGCLSIKNHQSPTSQTHQHYLRSVFASPLADLHIRLGSDLEECPIHGVRLELEIEPKTLDL